MRRRRVDGAWIRPGHAVRGVDRLDGLKRANARIAQNFPSDEKKPSEREASDG
jgi:hypothetical protein